MRVFLGGTVGQSKWRDYVMPRLDVDYFNPIVKVWDDDAWLRELQERKSCDFVLYVITPFIEGHYAIAEVIDDSYKRPDRTIYCYLPEEGGKAFDKQMIGDLERLGELVVENGGAWYHTLDEIIEVLNSAKANEAKANELSNSKINNIFISYGRRHSIDFARKLYKQLTDGGYNVWFDMNDIPLGVDFQEQIDDGIKLADNFIFVISPHSVKSIYCRKEIELALMYNKRIIPLLHVEPTDCFDKMHPVIGKLNWIYFNDETKFDASFNGLSTLVDSHADYVRMHTLLLIRSLRWESDGRPKLSLLSGKERVDAEEWLLKNDFVDANGLHVQAPCLPTHIHSKYITDSREYANDGLTDVFISYDTQHREIKTKIVDELTRQGVTTWLHDEDIELGEDFEKALIDGVIETDSVLLLLSPDFMDSHYCRLEIEKALEMNKRIIPLLIAPMDTSTLPEALRVLQYIDFTNLKEKSAISELTHDNVAEEVASRREKSDFEQRMDKVIVEINKNKDYYNRHKNYLVEALRWEESQKAESMLLRGFRIENSASWLTLSEQMPHKALDLHRTFITESELNGNYLDTAVFIAYHNYDHDFARKLNNSLRRGGRITWFDQGYMPEVVEPEPIILKAIEDSDNFVLVLSPDAVEDAGIQKQLQHAIDQEKRIIPILWRQPGKGEVVTQLADLKWISFEGVEFYGAFSKLIRFLDFDREHVQLHTQYAKRAGKWLENDKNNELLLREIELYRASNWAESAGVEKKHPPITSLQKEFISESQKAFDLQVNKQNRTRITRNLSIIGLVVVLFAMGVYNYLGSKKIMVEQIEEWAEEVSKSATTKIEFELQSLQNAPQTVKYMMKNHDNTDSVLGSALEDILKQDPYAKGIGISYEPYAYKSDVKAYSPYYRRMKDGRLEYEDLGKDTSYNYFEKGWYANAIETGEPTWIDPYQDPDGLLFSYSVPFFDDKGDVAGVVSSDLSFLKFDAYIHKIKILETGYVFLVANNGTIYSHPDSAYLIKESLQSLSTLFNQKELLELKNSLGEDKEGMIHFDQFMDKKDVWIHYQDFKSRDWSLCILFPDQELMKEIKDLSIESFYVFGVGLIILLIVVLLVYKLYDLKKRVKMKLGES